jgi:hypothetical protein
LLDPSHDRHFHAWIGAAREFNTRLEFLKGAHETGDRRRVADYVLNFSRFCFIDYCRRRAKKVRVRTWPLQGKAQDAALFDCLDFKGAHMGLLRRSGRSGIHTLALHGELGARVRLPSGLRRLLFPCSNCARIAPHRPHRP